MMLAGNAPAGTGLSSGLRVGETIVVGTFRRESMSELFQWASTG